MSISTIGQLEDRDTSSSHLRSKGEGMPLTIGEVAAKSGCSAPTVRYYEEIGLLPAVERTLGGRRAYSWPQVHRLTFIRRARDLGLSIDQVRELLRIYGGDQADCGDAQTVLGAYLDEVRRRRAELEALEDVLARMAQRCGDTCANVPEAACTVMEDVLSARSETPR
jgi:MerR family transcriptional regulator, copper efflux regulator